MLYFKISAHKYVAAQYLLGFNSNIKERVKYIALYDSMPKPNRNKRIVAYIVCSISSFT